MSDPAKELNETQAQITKTAAYHRTKNGFNINFLRSALSNEIARLIELQQQTVSILDKMIEDLKKRPLNGGSE